jgi:alkylhydroperoxidase family enzyme
MARVPYPSVEDLAAEDRFLIPRNLNIQRALANNPAAFRQFAHIGMWFRFECELEPRLRELAILATGYAQASGYEFSHHLKVSKDFGITDDDIRAVIDEHGGNASGLPPLERAVIAAANQLTVDGVIEEVIWQALAAELSRDRMIELVLLISFYNHFARVMAALEVDIEPEYQKLMVDYPPPLGFTSWR